MKDGSKRYYWIKLKKDFFDLPEIDFLQDQKNGCEYIVLYQKLCLLAANHEGKLVRQIGEMIIPYDAKKIAEVTRFKFDTVVVALELYGRLGLVVQEGVEILHPTFHPGGDPIQKVFIIPNIETMIGSETKWAEKKRLQAEKKLPALTSGTCRRVNRESIKLPNGKTYYIDEKRYGGNGALAFDRAGCRCQMCGTDENLLIHHNNGYSNTLEDLVILCKGCHGIVHSKEYGGVFGGQRGGKQGRDFGGTSGGNIGGDLSGNLGGMEGGKEGGNGGGKFPPKPPPNPPPQGRVNFPPKSSEYRYKTGGGGARTGADAHALLEENSGESAPKTPENPEMAGAIALFESVIHPIANEAQKDRLLQLGDDYGWEWVRHAVLEAGVSEGKTIRYVEVILSRWRAGGHERPWEEDRKHGKHKDNRTEKPVGRPGESAPEAGGEGGIDWSQFDNTAANIPEIAGNLGPAGEPSGDAD